MTSVPCSVNGCERLAECAGYCGAHYQRVRTTGKPGPATIRPRHSNPEDSFAANTTQQGEHLIWTGLKDPKGYGHASFSGKSWLVHRYSYTRAYGPIPEGMHIDHACRVPSCVEPTHLRAVTPKQNQEHRESSERGVTWDRDNHKWRAKVTHNRKNFYLGRFVNKQDAVDAVVAKRNELFTHNDYDRAA